LMGENGSGKTTVFEVLRRLQGFISGAKKTDDAFPPEGLTRWQKLNVQKFELEVRAEEDVYIYSLAVEHDRSSGRARITREELRMNQHRIYQLDGEAAMAFSKDANWEVRVPFEFGCSGIAFFRGRSSLDQLARFGNQVARIAVVRPLPMLVGSESSREESQLSQDAGNFVSWYRYLSQEHQGNILELTQQLREVIPGFDSFSLREAGEKVRVLKVLMRNAKDAKPIAYNFDELSDGQRQLILLYTLLYGVKGEGYCLFLDEPDNFVALHEIQPWLTALHDACGNEISQAVLISHSPEITDYLAASKGRWFERPDNGPVRVKDMPPPTDGLTASETIARGWVE